MEPLRTLRKPLIIAGPCSAESEEQVMEIATALAGNNDVALFRAGIWKPRTRPGFFEGVGTPGLKWLQRVKRDLGLECLTEVGTARHVDEALNHGLRVLWIGARTTVNPFAVSEIAEAVRGTDIEVMIKNPINADLELWIGAVERIQAAGIEKISLIHRGFSSAHKSKYRNLPLWELAGEMRARYPHHPFICDPSHIAGKRYLLQEIIVRALQLNYDGLMIETHNHPDMALSDRQQQITPAELRSMLSGLSSAMARNEPGKLSLLREDIDLIDDHFLELLGKRIDLVTKIGNVKMLHNQEVIQKDRWKTILDRLIAEAEKRQISTSLITEVFNVIHTHSVNTQLSLKK